MKILLRPFIVNNKLSQKSDNNAYNSNLALSGYDSVTFGSLNPKQLESVFDLAYVKSNKIDLNNFDSYDDSAFHPLSHYDSPLSVDFVKWIETETERATGSTNKDFNKWIKSETEQIMDLTQYKGKSEETTDAIRDILKQWKDYLNSDEWKSYLESGEWKGEQNDEYYNKATPALTLLVFNSIAKNVDPNRKNLPPKLDTEVLKKTAKSLKEDVLSKPKFRKFNFSNMYKDNLKLKYSGIKYADGIKKEGYWMYIPSKEHDPENFSKNIETLRANSCSSWSVRSVKANRYLKNADCYLFLEGHKAKVIIKVVNGEVHEIQGTKNTWRIPTEYNDEIQALVDKLKAESRLRKPKSIKGRLLAIPYRSFLKKD
jgi:hypothetical protein